MSHNSSFYIWRDDSHLIFVRRGNRVAQLVLLYMDLPRVASYVNFDTVKIIRTIGVDEASDMGDKFLPRKLATYPCVRAILIAMQLMRSCPYDVNLG